jgi:hypothetical protein
LRRIDVGNSGLNTESAFTPENACGSVADAELPRKFALRLRLNRQTFISNRAACEHRSKTKSVSLPSLMCQPIRKRGDP